MSKLRASVTAFMIAAVAAGGVVLTAGPASADTPQLVCINETSAGGAPLAHCQVSDPDGIRSVQVKNTATNEQQTSVAFDCANSPTEFNFNVPRGTKYKVFISDCAAPRNKATYVLRADGTVV